MSDISTENLASHRAHVLQITLPFALEYGAMETDPVFEPLKVPKIATVLPGPGADVP